LEFVRVDFLDCPEYVLGAIYLEPEGTMSKDPQEEYYRSYAQTRGQDHIHGSNEKVGWSADQRSGGGPNRSNGGGGCFPKGTLISTPLGGRDISTLQAGDRITVIDATARTQKSEKILKAYCHYNVALWLIKFSDGSSIRTTGIHSFLVNGAWQRAKQIRPGDTLAFFSASGNKTAKYVEWSRALSQREDVYNLIVEREFHFLANGFLAHSFSYFRATRILAWNLWSWLRSKRLSENSVRDFRHMVSQSH
jgi:hypothetical protein